ncbi:MAG: alanine racemase protein, partial [Clostridia bacterium]|nr:alanine racemase protein [Clostridia bacterium]
MIKDNLEQIHMNIKKAAQKAKRDEKDITLIAVSKTYPISDIKEAIRLGCKNFGENRVQELTGKIS